MNIKPLQNLTRTLALVLFWSPLLFSQGQGTPGTTGLVPRIIVDHREVGVANNLVIDGLTPGTSVTLAVALSENIFPLQGLGYGPAIFGPDLSSPFGAAAFPGLIANTNGEVHLPFVGSMSSAHIPFHFQAYAIDAGAPFGGVSFSRYEVLSFGLEPEITPIRFDLLGNEAWLQIFSYGALATPTSPELNAASPRDIFLASSNETASARSDTSTQITIAGSSKAIHLPNGATLHGVQSPTNETGFVLVDPKGSIELLAWDQGTSLLPAFANVIASSEHDPYSAFVSPQGLAAYSNANLLVVRNDGWNIPGSHLDYFALQAPNGIPIEPTSMCFLNGALFFGDGAQVLYRLDLQTWVTTAVVFPASGGLTPIYLDETMACAADGTALALGAGVDKFNHDIFVVDASGLATNLTNLPGDYEDAGIGEASGMQMAMNGDGSQVAYMRTVLETELFTKSTTPGATETHVTHAAQYIDSIDTIVGLGYKTSGDLVFSAGKDLIEVDTYRAIIPALGGPVTTVANETGTSGILAPIYDLGASLTLAGRLTTDRGALLHFTNSSGPGRLQLLGPNTQSLPLDVGTMQGVLALPNCVVVVDESAPGVQRIRELNTLQATLNSTFTSAPGSTFLAMVKGSGQIAVLLQTPTGSQVVLRTTGGLISFPGPSGILSGGIRLLNDGSILVITTHVSTGLTELWARNPQSGVWALASSMNQSAASAVFLR